MPDELLYRRAPAEPATLDREAGTVRVTWSTGVEVPRRDFEGPYIERLSMDPAHVRLDALRTGPVLDSHRQESWRDTLGRVEAVGISDGAGWADIRLSRRADVAGIVQDIQDGIIRNISVGYTVQRWEESIDGAGRRVKEAVEWTPREISFVPLPADAGATVRAQTMPETVETPPPIENRAGAADDIRSLVDLAGLPEALGAELIQRGASLDDARAEVRVRLARAAVPQIQTENRHLARSGDEAPEVWVGRAGEALYTRVNPAHTPSEPARAYVGMTIPDLAREALTRAGIGTSGMAAGSLVTRAQHSNSDFKLILEDTVGRSIRAAYQAVPSGIRRLARETTARDFRAKSRLQLSNGPDLEKVHEGGEFTYGTFHESGESYKLATYGKIFGITRQALINDDLGAFADLPRRLGVGAADFEAQHLVDLLTANAGAGPTMSDSTALFHANHGNLAGSAGALDEGTLSAARLAMRRQTSLTGRVINVTPAFLLVPAALETIAEKLLSAVQATTTDDVNPFAALLLAVDPRLDDVSPTRWYLSADTAMFDGLEYAYLEGAPGPQIETRAGFNVDGMEVKVRLDFGGGFVDWRGWYCNDGS